MQHSLVFSVTCANQAETEVVAVKLAAMARPDDLLALTGDLGAGKTTFARAFIRAALKDNMAEVPSPTFTLVQTYDAAEYEIYHTDLYRLKDPDEVYDLGIEDNKAEAVMLVEWPDRMPEEWWHTALELRLKRPEGAPMGEDEARTIEMWAASDIWRPRLVALNL